MTLFEHELRSLAGYRIPFGFLVAPVIACFVVSLGVEAIQSLESGAEFDLRNVVLTAYQILVFAGPFGIVLAVPVFLLLKVFWKVRFLECTLGGALVGLPFGYFGLVLGVLSGIAFWVVALMGAPRPDSS